MRLGLLNITSSFILKIISKFFSVGLTLYLIKISSDVLSSQEISYWLTFVSITSFAYLFDFGITTAVAINFSESKKLQYSESSVVLTHILIILIILAFICSSFFKNEWLSDEIEFSSSLAAYIFIFFTSSIFLNIYFEKIFIGSRVSYYFYFFQIINYILILFLVTFYWKPTNILNYLYIYFFISFFPGVISWFLFIKNKLSLLIPLKTINKYLYSLKKSLNYWYIFLAYVFFIVLDFLILANYYGSENLLGYNLYLRVFQLVIIPPLFLTNISWGQFANHSFYKNKYEINKLFKLILIGFLMYFLFSFVFLLIYFQAIISYLNNEPQLLDNYLFYYFILRAFCEIFLMYFINLVNSLQLHIIFLKRLLFFSFFLFLGKIIFFYLYPGIETLSIFMVISILFLLINFQTLNRKIIYEK